MLHPPLSLASAVALAKKKKAELVTGVPQALVLLNNRFVRARAMDFARRVKKGAGAEPEAQVRLAWRLALGREPCTDERASATAIIKAQLQQRSVREPGKRNIDAQSLTLADFCQAIFAINEFIYVD